MAADADIVALGEPLYEFSEISGQPRQYLQGFGGDTMNAAIAAARQGAAVAYVTRLGDDEFGRQFLALWREEGLDVSGVGIDREAPTGVYFIHYGAQGHVFSYLRAGSAASRMRADQLPLDLIRSARFFHTSAISQAISASACDAVFAAIETARAAGVAVAYDSNLRLRLWPLARAKAVITATVAMADYFLPSLDDVKALCGLEQPEAIVDWCHRPGRKTRRVEARRGRCSSERWTQPAVDTGPQGGVRRCDRRGRLLRRRVPRASGGRSGLLAGGALRQRCRRAHDDRLRRGRAVAAAGRSKRAARKCGCVLTRRLIAPTGAA